MKKKITKKAKPNFAIPASLLAPVGTALKEQLARLRANRAKVTESDPFKNQSRTDDNAALDTEAEEQYGHAMTSAVKKQLDRRIIQTKKALSKIKIGSYGMCEVCGNMIDTDRLVIYPEASKCITCENKSKKRKN